MLKSFIKTPNYEKIKASFRQALKDRKWDAKKINKFIYGDKISESSLEEYIRKIEQGIVFSSDKNVKNEYREDQKGLSIYDWYIKNKDRFSTFKEVSSDTRDGRNNRIFDIQWEVLTHKDTMDKMFNPGSFEVQKKSARIITILKNSSKYSYSELSKKKVEELDKLIPTLGRSILHPSTQIYFHKQNMTAGKLIGIFANNNTSHAFISLQDIYLNLEGELMFNSIKISNEENNKLDNLRGKDGSLISKTIAGFLAASVDAVKDPVLNYMNLNTFTANTAMLLARLGFDSDSIGLFLTQPIIEKVTQEYFKRSNEGYVDVENLINAFIPEHIDIETLQNNLSETRFTKEDLAEGIVEKVDNSEFQYMSLLLFKTLFDKAQDLNTLTFITKFNSVTNAVGPSIADTLVMQERYKKFIDRMESDNPPFSLSALNVLQNSPILEAFYDTTISDSGASKLIFEPYFPHYSPTFSSILDVIRRSIKGNLSSKNINKLINAFVMYKLTLGEDPVIDGSYKNRKKYIIDYVNSFNDLLNKYSDNALLRIFNITSPTKKCSIPTLDAKTGGYSIDAQENIKNSWSNLITNPDTRQDGIDLLIYNIFRSGFGFSPKTAGHLASVDVKLGFNNYVDTIRNPHFNDDKVNIISFVIQFLRNNTSDFSLVPTIESDKKITVSTSKVTKETVLSIPKDYDAIIATKGEVNTYCPVIIYEDRVYMNPKVQAGIVKYAETTTLGNPNNFVEYDGNDSSNMKTVISKPKEFTRDEQSSEPSKKYNSYTTKQLNKALQEVITEEEVKEFTKSKKKVKQDKLNTYIDSVSEILNLSDAGKAKFEEVIKDKVLERINNWC